VQYIVHEIGFTPHGLIPRDRASARGRSYLDMKSARVAFYIDGFNLYFGLKDSGYRRFYWLNLQEMCSRLLLPDQQLKIIRYFTARISKPEAKRLRQKTYLQALETLPNLDMHFGVYYANDITCNKCGNTILKSSEKKTDVNIAVKMITDAMDDLYDIAVLVGADSDLVPVVSAVKKYFSKKKIVLFFPPGRKSAELRNTCHRFGGVINKTTLKNSQFDDTVSSKTGYPLKRPVHWS